MRSAAQGVGPPPKLVIAGGRGWYYHQIFAHVVERGLDNQVLFPGFLPGDELPWWYRAADLFIYPSLFEGFGLPVLEAMACGTPTVTSATSSLPEVAGDAALLVEAEDTQALAAAIDQVLGDPPLAAELSRRGLGAGSAVQLGAHRIRNGRAVLHPARRRRVRQDIRPWVPWPTLLADALFINVAFRIAYWMRYDLQWFRAVDPANNVPYDVYLPLVALLTVVLLLLNRREGAYDAYRPRTFFDDCYVVVNSTTTSIMLLIVIASFIGRLFYSRMIFIYAGLLIIVLLGLVRLLRNIVLMRCARPAWASIGS